MDARQNRKHRHDDEQPLQRAEECAEPPARMVHALEKQRVHDGEDPAVDHVDDESDHLRPIAVGSEHRADDERNVDAREAQ